MAITPLPRSQSAAGALHRHQRGAVVTALLLTGLIPLTCRAQQAGEPASSAVQIYGILDIGIESVNNGSGTRTSLTSGIADGSRLGFKGSEDLGGGWKAIFTLESRVELDTGGISNSNASRSASTSLPPSLRGLVDTGALSAETAAAIQEEIQRGASTVNERGAFFDRQAFVGLVTPAGAFMLGRQYTPAYVAFSYFDSTESATAASPAQSYLGLPARADNAISHVIQGVGPISTYLMYAPSEGRVGGIQAGTLIAGMIRYTNAGLDLALGSDRYRAGTSSGTGLRTMTVAAAYSFDGWRLSYAQVRARNPASITDFTSPNASIADLDGTVGALMSIDQRVHHFGVRWSGGPHTVAVAVNLVRDQRKQIAADVDHFGVLYRYALSKRTGVYGALAYANNKGLARVGLNAAGTAGGFTRDFGVDSRVVQIGIQHRF